LLQTLDLRSFFSQPAADGPADQLFKGHGRKIFFCKPCKKRFDLLQPHIDGGISLWHTVMQQDNIIRPDFFQYPFSQTLAAAIAGVKAAAAEGDTMQALLF
jgi:hypothetical protein